jgi:hypothetical protein
MSKMVKFTLPGRNLGAEIIPLVIRDKDLPPLPNHDRVNALVSENDLLRTENRALRAQLDMYAHQTLRFHQGAKAGRAFAKEVAQGMRGVHEAASAMRKTERAAEKEWADFQGRFEEEEARIQNFI